MKKLSALLLTLLLVVALASCGVIEMPANAEFAEAALKEAYSVTELEVTENFTLDKTIVDKDGHKYDIVWTSSNEAAATVVDGADKVTVKITPSYFEDVVFTVTGTITEGDVTATVVLTYTVPRLICTHEYEIIKTVDANCGVDGYQSYECKHCGRRYMETLKATGDHRYELAEHVDAEATAHGYDLYHCDVCNGDKTVTLHAFVYEYEDTAPTCTEDGLNIMICYVCAEEGYLVYDENDPDAMIVVPATGVHEYTEELEKVDATCTEEGYVINQCYGCELTERKTLPAGHVDTDDCICDREGCDAEVIPEAGSAITIKQALYIADKQTDGTYTAGKYIVTGKVARFAEGSSALQYGNLYIADEDGNELYVYGVYSAQGTFRYDGMPNAPVVDDVITLTGVLGSYKNNNTGEVTIQMKSGWIVHECEYEYVCTSCVDCGEYKEAEDHTGGTATCTEKAVCTVCGGKYGELLAHTGGTATCQAKAVCTVCTTPYGELAAHVWGADNKCTTTGCTEEKPTEGTQTQTQTVTYNFSALTANGNELKNGAAAAVLNGADGGVQDIIASTTETKIYSGNGSGGILGETDSKTKLIKFGTTSVDGVLVIDFVDGVKVTKVEIKCHTFKLNKETTLKVNEAAAQNTALNAPATVLTFNIEAANEITITSSGPENHNVVVFEIVVTYTVES